MISDTLAAFDRWLVTQPPVEVCLLTGSRTWPRPSLVRVVLDRLPATAVLRHGGATRGADRHGDTIWRLLQPVGRRRLDVHPVTPEQWAVSRAAGHMRNDRMVALGASCCVAFIFRASAGATHCADAAEAAGIPTFRFELPEQE